MILPPSSIFSQPCPCIACIRCYVISPPAFLSAYASSSISRLPFCEPLCPPVVFPPYQLISPLGFFDFQHDIFYFGLFPYLRVSGFVPYFYIQHSPFHSSLCNHEFLFEMFSCGSCFCPIGHCWYYTLVISKHREYLRIFRYIILIITSFIVCSSSNITVWPRYLCLSTFLMVLFSISMVSADWKFVIYFVFPLWILSPIFFAFFVQVMWCHDEDDYP